MLRHRAVPPLLALALALALAVQACADQTSIQVVVISETLDIPADVDQLEFDVFGEASGAMVVDRRYTVETDWPHSLSVRPGADDTEEVRVVVTAYGDARVVGTAEARSQFVPGETVVLEVRLGPGGGTDGGMDAGVDAGDAGGPSCTTAADCDDGVHCTIDSCTGGECMSTPSNAQCAERTTCDPVDDCPPRTCTTTEDCVDARLCDGDEACVDGECVRGTPPDCDDDDDCTDDACVDTARMCVQTTRDADGDGFGDETCAETGGVPATDCNDGNPDVFPGAPEVCNGLDDDCNGTCDDSFTCCVGESGSCTTSCDTTGNRVCNTSCAWSVCAPPPEQCNGVDDDCNGAADDVYACVRGATRSCTSSCGSTGTQTCGASCEWSTCMPPAETCNGADDDCDGTADDGFGCIAGSTASCTTSCTSTGTRTCSSTACTLGTCTPPAEGCTGMDDDCDGMVDETAECSPGTMAGCTTSCGTTGARTCSATCMYSACTPPAETCNGTDDDCDGLIDETFTCVPGASGSCTTSCGTTGSRTCTSSCSWGTCTPPIEACNGLDDDCDGMRDETFTCAAGSSGSCTTGCGSTGSRTCSPTCAWSACSPPAETCNGMDDDCNGSCDDGFGCCAGATGSCTTTCGSSGSRTCSSSCAWGGCAPPAEACNGMDDDCDTTIDEGFTCIAGTMGSCTTSCMSTGTRTCSTSTCTWGMCNPPTESCNGVDDDCDGMVDEGCGMCSGCAGATTASAPGGRYTLTLAPHAQTGTCGGAGSEAYLTFTLGATSDVFITTHQTGSIDTVLYVRQCQCTGTQAACNDDADGRTTSTLRLNSLAAGTYTVIVDTKSAMSGTVTVDLYISTPGMQSDRCGNPSFIAAGTGSISGTTCGYSHDVDYSVTGGCDFPDGGNSEDRIYYFYLPSSQSVTFDGCQSSVNFDSVFYVRRVCTDPSLANQSACNDDNCGGPPGCGGAYRASLTTTIGPGLYYFVVDGWDPAVVPCPCGNYAANLTGI